MGHLVLLVYRRLFVKYIEIIILLNSTRAEKHGTPTKSNSGIVTISLLQNS